MTTPAIPLIDIADLVAGNPGRAAVARQIDAACRQDGFFYIRGHGVPAELIERLDTLSRQFFALDEATKLRWRMALGGRAWRGYFPTGGELTSGRPDWKEGLYFGSELGPEHPLVQAGTPLHGANLFPDVIPGLRETVLAYMDAVTQVGHRLMEGLSLALGLPADYFADHYTRDPLILFRIFDYPSQPLPPELANDEAAIWGVGEHTDYGVLTILLQDDTGGLQVRTRGGWVEAPPIPGTFVCNIGDMLERLSAGQYRSTPHRVRRNTSGRDRLSFPLFFDPAFTAPIRPIEGLALRADADDSAERWDGRTVHTFDGNYGDYLLGKVAKVFPQLRQDVL